VTRPSAARSAAVGVLRGAAAVVTIALAAALTSHWEATAIRRNAESRAVLATGPSVGPPEEEMVGPFASWADAQGAYGAVGDGVVDDTAALQRGLNALGTGGGPAVLYLPAGTYRLTHTLVLARRRGVAVVGEDPASTTVRWDGPAGEVMLDLNGVAYSRFARITWDGAGRARTAIAHGWDGQGPVAGTGNEHADEVFVDADAGIRAGVRGFMDAEAVVRRCRFLRNRQAGVSIETWNALDWFVWDSVFEDNGYGVTNVYGAGNFHVYGSLFRNSATADLAIGNTGYFSFRNNTSIGSRMFFSAAAIGSPAALTTLQGNTVLDPQQPLAVAVNNPGPLLLLDNHFRSRPGQRGPVVRVVQSFTTRSQASGLSVGNVFTVPEAVDVRGTLIAVDDRVAAPEELRPPALPPGTPPSLRRPLVEVPPGASGAAVQDAIAQAAALTGQRPVVHLPSGTYPVERPLTVPPGSDLQLVGDGETSVLSWTGPDDGSPVLHLAGPTRATVRDLAVAGAGRADGVLLDDVDQEGARVYADQGFVYEAVRAGILADGLGQAAVRLDGLGLLNNEVGLQVTGAGGPPGPAGVAVLGGAAGGNRLTYTLSQGGRLLVWDHWYEGTGPQFARLSGGGVFTLHGAMVAAADPNHGAPGEPAAGPAAVEVDDFRGEATLLGTQLAVHNRLRVSGPGPGTSVLALGMVGVEADYLLDEAPSARLALLNSRRQTQGGRSEPVPDRVRNVEGVDAFVRELLTQTRGETPARLLPLPPGVTDARLFRVSVAKARIGLHLRPGPRGGTDRPPSPAPPSA
jgi:hypothetical protein